MKSTTCSGRKPPSQRVSSDAYCDRSNRKIGRDQAIYARRDEVYKYLLTSLEQLAIEAGKPETSALEVLRRILQNSRQINDDKIDELRHKQYQQRVRNQLAPVREVFPHEFAIRLVCCKTLTDRGMSESEAREQANKATWETLSKVERRAVEKLSAEPRPRARPYIERRATSLERAVRKDWPTMLVQRAPQGRPPGWRPKAIPPDSPEQPIVVPISIPEAVSCALPEIEALTGYPIKPSVRGRKIQKIPSSLGLKAVVLAVQLIRSMGPISEAELESIRRGVARAHRKG
jgi:hypothetical protein